MWFLIKGTFWFTLVLVALSFFSGGPAEESEAKPQFDVTNAVSAAAGVYQYLSKLCFEKPEVCEKGAETLTALGERARDGAHVAFEFLDKQLSEEEKAAMTAAVADAVSEEIVTGTVTPFVPIPLEKPER